VYPYRKYPVYGKLENEKITGPLFVENSMVVFLRRLSGTLSALGPDWRAK